MVEEITNTSWVCPYCNGKFEDRDDAVECAESCADVDEPEEDEETIFICEMCDKKFDDYTDALECEEEHKIKQDKYWERYDEVEKKKRLAEAGAHPQQEKITNFK